MRSAPDYSDRPIYDRFSKVDGILQGMDVTAAIIPAPNWADECVFENAGTDSCRRSGVLAEFILLMADILAWNLTFIPAIGYGYPGLATPDRNTVFELLKDGRADISANPIVLTTYPIFTWPYAFVSAAVPSGAVNFDILKTEVWLVLGCMTVSGYALYFAMSRLQGLRLGRNFLLAYTLFFFGLLLEWYPSLLAVEIVMQKLPPPPFKNALELAQQLIDGDRRFVYQQVGQSAFEEVIKPESKSGHPVYAKLMELKSTDPLAVPKALAADARLVYVDVEPLAKLILYQTCAGQVIPDHSIPAAQLSFYTRPGLNKTMPFIDDVEALFQPLLEKYLSKDEIRCNETEVEREWRMSMPSELTMKKFQSVTYFLLTGALIAAFALVLEFFGGQRRARTSATAKRVVKSGRVGWSGKGGEALTSAYAHPSNAWHHSSYPILHSHPSLEQPIFEEYGEHEQAESFDSGDEDVWGWKGGIPRPHVTPPSLPNPDYLPPPPYYPPQGLRRIYS